MAFLALLVASPLISRPLCRTMRIYSMWLSLRKSFGNACFHAGVVQFAARCAVIGTGGRMLSVFGLQWGSFAFRALPFGTLAAEAAGAFFLHWMPAR